MPEHQVENLSHRSHLICMQHNSPIQCYDIRCLLKVNSYRPIRVSNAAIYKLIQQDLCPFFLSFVFFGSPLCTRYYNFLMFSIIVFKLTDLGSINICCTVLIGCIVYRISTAVKRQKYFAQSRKRLVLLMMNKI